MKSKKRISLLRFWTTRYLLTLCIGLILIGVISAFWIRYTALENRTNIAKLLAEEVAERVVDTQGQLKVTPALAKIVDERQKFMPMEGHITLFVIDNTGGMVFSTFHRVPPSLQQALSKAIINKSQVEKMVAGPRGSFYIVKRQIIQGKAPKGWIVLMYPDEAIKMNKEEIELLLILLGSLALLGWIVIYLLSRKLSEPIQEVASAANQILRGDYDIQLNRDIREQEVYELIQSFREMAHRLHHLESLRSELLAGVTHELKTPVASISGLVQAVKDDIVVEEEAKEFLEISLKEAGRLQKMVEDLLDFNSFAVGEITVNKERLSLNALVQEICYQWSIVQDEGTKLLTHLPQEPILFETDPVRIQQILINLLNNAKQAIGVHGEIDVTVYQRDEDVFIDVRDNGSGIPAEEQDLIFERFFRGAEKKHKVRGLGLGLPFSKIMAKAMGGELVLKESSNQGTTFTLILGRHK
jgi:signal transduction histidine kinase